jgi:pyridoxal phosphate enzyme (YggS family)
MASILTVGENIRNFLQVLPEPVTLIGVTKTVGIDKIREAAESGLKDIGENKVQEALDKFPHLQDLNLKWHFIGTLQSNKVKKVLKIFDLIHSVDKIELAEMINTVAGKLGKKQEILLQVNISREDTKSGFDVDKLMLVLPRIAKLGSILVKGLMTIGPNTVNVDHIRDCFISLRVLKDRINQEKYFDQELNILSMGMTNDFKIAIEEGATMIRVGRAIFGERQ